jgi:hypothetical protein
MTIVAIEGKKHTYMAYDGEDAVFREVKQLVSDAGEIGYIPDTRFVLHDIDEEGKKKHLCGHSEKRALAIALKHTSHNEPILLIKNLRVCLDCHTLMKYISKAKKRKILMRDATRFHEFENGICNCNDYW